jgi:hypothetical protein
MTLLQKNTIVFAVILCAFSLTAQAQSTPAKPYEGASHTYVVDGLTSGVEYTFFMASSANESDVLDDVSVSEFDFLGTQSGIVEPGQSAAALPVLWNFGAADHIYYLWIKLQNPDGCSTSRYLRIVPQQNMFDLLSENIPVDNTESCPSIEEESGFNPMFSEFNAGTTTIKFKVRREGGTRGWMFEPHVSMNPSWNVDTEIVSVKAVNAGVLTANEANIYTVPASDSEVVVTVAVRNYEGTEQLVSLEIRKQKEEQTLLFDANPDNDKVEHRISVMPVISELEEI